MGLLERMKKTKLLVDYDYDFDLMGITASVKFHKLSWSINSKLNIRLVKQRDYVLDETAPIPQSFLNFNYSDDSCSIQLFRNKSPDSDQVFILPEMTHYDYILKINGQLQTFAIEEVMKQLRDVKYIEYIAAISLEQLKSKDNFLN